MVKIRAIEFMEEARPLIGKEERERERPSTTNKPRVTPKCILTFRLVVYVVPSIFVSLRWAETTYNYRIYIGPILFMKRELKLNALVDFSTKVSLFFTIVRAFVRLQKSIFSYIGENNGMRR